jgi:hypothetical protein
MTRATDSKSELPGGADSKSNPNVEGDGSGSEERRLCLRPAPNGKSRCLFTYIIPFSFPR